MVYSHLQEHKDLETVIRGYALLKEKVKAPPLVIVGGKDNLRYLRLLEALVDEKNLHEYVKFTGGFDRKYVGELIRNSLCVIFPSLVETMPVTLAEEMLCGAAIVACDSGVTPGIAGDSVCLLYTSPSPRDRTRSRMPSSA